MKRRLLNTMSNKLLFTNIAKLYSLKGGVRSGENLKDNGIIKNAYIYVEDGIIREVGEINNFKSKWNDATIVDMNNMIVTPGFIDCHTHLVFAGNRNNEYIKKLNGISYLEILKAGGGILSTVNATKDATILDLYKNACFTAAFMLSKGVTTIEVKSGYGLDFLTEVKQLNVVKMLNENLDIDFIPTYLGAHALPEKYHDDIDGYIKFMIETVMPYIKKEDLAIFVDVFCEKGIFELKHTEEILVAAKELGFKLKLHADEMYPLGGASLAAKYQCISADHLMNASNDDLVKMRDNNVVAVLLPMTSFNLNKPVANLSFMKENNLVIALASDFNPGSSPCSDFVMMMRVASRLYRLTPSEILSMVTINAAKALDLDSKIGSIEVGKKADFIVFNNEDFDNIIINMGSTYIVKVYKEGKLQEVLF